MISKLEIKILVEHAIHTGNCKPVRNFPYRTSPHGRQIVVEEVKQMLKRGIIQPSSSAWAANVVLVKKKSGSHRF